MRRHKLRSPFWGATRHDVEMIREAVIMVRVWERTIPHEVVDFPSPWDAETPRSLRERALFAGLIDRAVRSAMRRLDARPDSAVSEHNHFLAGLRRHDASAYETRMLREEIAALKGSLIASGHLA